MKLRCDLHLNGGSRKLLLVPGPNETPQHLALKLAAYLMFWDFEPIVEASGKHPALLQQEFIPDLMGLDEAGAVRLWVECGNVTLHKIGKLLRRFPAARLVVLKATEREALRLRASLSESLEKGSKIEILAWPGKQFEQWLGIVWEKTEVYGEAGDRNLNLVINEVLVVADFKVF